MGQIGERQTQDGNFRNIWMHEQLILSSCGFFMSHSRLSLQFFLGSVDGVMPNDVFVCFWSSQYQYMWRPISKLNKCEISITWIDWAFYWLHVCHRSKVTPTIKDVWRLSFRKDRNRCRNSAQFHIWWYVLQIQHFKVWLCFLPSNNLHLWNEADADVQSEYLTL